MKTAIIQCADTGPLESLVIMLRSVGYECLLPDRRLRNELRSIGCDTVYEIEDLVNHWGYDAPMKLGKATTEDMDRCSLYVDIKAHRAHPHLIRRWPRLEKRVLWYRINGGQPEHVIRRHEDGSLKEDCGNEANPPCPVLTPNQWYKQPYRDGTNPSQALAEVMDETDYSHAYACWPPFHRFSDYSLERVTKYESPICLIHKIVGWGYGKLVEPLREMGVRCHGVGSPDGLLPHSHVRARLAKVLCMVHLKSNDAPGYALYEALAAACPIVCTRRLIWRCRMQDLLIPNETCLVFDRETHEGLNETDVINCVREVAEAMSRLTVREENERIGKNGRKRLLEVMWNEQKPEDVNSLREFMKRNFAD